MDEMASSIQLLADQYRAAYRMPSPFPLECRIPHHEAEHYIKKYGSLQAAADALFDPGTVKLIDVYWEDWCFELQERVNARLGRRRPAPAAPRRVPPS